MTTHVSFTLFVDYLMASGPSRISMIQDHLSPRDGEFDCYAPFKAAMADIMRTGMQRGILPFWVKEHGGRARDNLLDLAAGFLQREGQIQGWSEPTILPLPIGSDCSVDVNPEIGGMVGGVPTWIKLYLRKEPLLYDRMLVMMAVLKRARHGNGNGHGNSLAIEAQRLLPTPKATNNENDQSQGWRNLGTELGPAKIVPRGAHMPQPSPDGSPSPDDQLPGQLNLDEPESA
jgi:hypothetical protein